MDDVFITFLNPNSDYLVAGDMLIFMPGQEDIEVTCDLVTGKVNILLSFFFF